MVDNSDAPALLPLTTDRLIVRPLSHDDIPALQRIGGDPAVAPNLFSVTTPWPAPSVVRWIDTSVFQNRIGFRVGVALRDTSKDLIGVVGVGGRPADLSYFIDPAMQGRGYATEAARAVLTLCHDAFGLSQVAADHFDDNPASGRVLSKLGFRVVGHDMGTSAARATPAPITLMRCSLPRRA